MNRRFRTAAAAAACAAALALSACGSSSGTTAPATPNPTVLATPVPAQTFSAALVTDVGRLHDRSFNDLAWRGMRRARRILHISIHVLQSGSEGDYVGNLTRFARQHVSLIVAVGASMAPAVDAVAKQYPDQRFALVDARPVDTGHHEVRLANVASLFFREQQSGYLVGVLAGLLERHHVGNAVHNTIGYLGGASIPQVNRYLAGYVAGAERADPGIKIVGDYAQSFTDIKTGQAFGQSQVGQGVDIFFQVAAQSGLGYLSVAQAHGLYGIGVDANQAYLGPSVITSALKRVNVAVFDIIQDVHLGRFRAGDHIYGAAQGAIGFAAPAHLVPASLVSETRRYQRELASGKIVPPVAIPAR